MNIVLPKAPFSYNDGAAVMEGNILYIYRQVNFYNLMSELTYACFGRKICHYCKKPILETKLTVDHKIPRCFGGPTITNNLAPTCKSCNSRKGNMFENEFFDFMQIGENQESKTLFKEQVEKSQRLIYCGDKKPLPEDWLLETTVNVISIRYQLNEPLGEGFHKLENKFKKYGRFFKPIIISSNRYLLDGFNVCLIAKIHNVSDRLEIIQLDNVVCMY